MYMRFLNISFIITILCISLNTNAESTKFVQWMGEFIPKYDKIFPGHYQNGNSLQYQDVNGDGIYNDALVWGTFDLTKPFSPQSYIDTGKAQHTYRTDFPNAIFYGGSAVRFANVSDLTIVKKDKEYNPFTRISQGSVQPRDGSRPCSYNTDFPDNIYHGGQRDKEQISDMTFFVVSKEKWKLPMSTAFHEAEDAKVNLSLFFLWKKADFINGGADVEHITFDATSKISVNFTRFRKNIKEGRFIVQDGEQFWISKAVSKSDGDEESSVGIDGMEVNIVRYGAVTQLSPLNSLWAKYEPRQDTEKVDKLTATLKDMEYDPKLATDEEKQLYQTNSDSLLAEVNKIQFNPQTATFVEHDFKDIQSVGVYFATDDFTHQTTILVFDNFNVSAVGVVPEGKAISISQQDNTINVAETSAKMTGGISVNCGPYEQVKLTQCVPDNVRIRGKITVASSDVGKQADIIALGIHRPYKESDQETFYTVLNEGQAVEEWDGNLENLHAFQKNVKLQAEHNISIYQGKIPLPGFVRVLFGYRLEDGSIIYNADNIDMFVFTASSESYNDLPYEETIQGLCP
ncbi:MAG: hypothetical protein KAG43_03550 [Candidatus Marithrix sp.]|nr:hypothetical protein [Candidatus Marithrix sp.]